MATITVQAGEHARRHCPVWLPVDVSALPGGDVGLRGQAGEVLPAQVLAGESPALCFVIPSLARGQSAAYEVIPHSADTGGVGLADVPGDRVEVTLNDSPFTSYHYADTWARPFLLPIIGPFGDPITRHFPVEDVDGEAQDHPHHKSCWVAWGEVNGSDHWSEAENRFARQVHQRFDTIESGPVFGRIVATNHWLDLQGEVVLEEQRTLTFYNVPAAERLMDLKVVFTATCGPVEFGDTKEGGICSIRVATTMDAKKDGTIVNSYGGTNEAETWGKRASWCDY
ncbi:MAG: PmoA family protein, partial [Lentisphaerae bacterium]|nr:PmoA family protein [Lentisphaerota bacterium]